MADETKPADYDAGTQAPDFTGTSEPFGLFEAWFAEAKSKEPNDPEAMALATVDADGLPNVRMVLLKGLDGPGRPDRGFVFYTNYESAKAGEIDAAGCAAFVMHWKSLRRQVRARGTVTREDGPQADAYYRSRSLPSRLGAWASKQSRPLRSRGALIAEVAKVTATKGIDPARPPFWGGYRIVPVEIEFWADGAHRLHDRFRWTRPAPDVPWQVVRLSP
jgi:pyridoxamine 5'-phosphate oxidase